MKKVKVRRGRKAIEHEDEVRFDVFYESRSGYPKLDMTDWRLAIGVRYIH
jgi:hypothetical protein